MKLDLKAAFYRLNIKKILDELDFFHKSIQTFLNDIYLNKKYYLENELNETILITYKELFLNLPSSDYLFSYFMTKVNNNLNLENYFLYVDDYIIFANTKEELENNKLQIIEILKNYGLELNDKKTQIYDENDSIKFLNRYIRLNVNNSNDVEDLEKIIESKRKFSSVVLDYKTCENIKGFKEFYKEEMNNYIVLNSI